MSLSTYFATARETKERHSVESLRTRYYRTNYTKIKETLLKYAIEQSYEVSKVNDNYGEIFIQMPKGHIVCTVVQINPLETAVDLKVEVYQLMGRNKPLKKIISLYEYLDKVHPFKGVGLHP